MNADTSDFLPQVKPEFPFFSDFADKAEIIFWAADPTSFQIVYLSQFADEVLGVPLAAWKRPLFWQNHLYVGDKERVLALFATAVSTEETHELEYRLTADDGSLRWFRDKVCLLTFEDRLLLCGMMTDVTSFKTAVGHHVGLPGYTSVFLEIVQLLSENVDIRQRLYQLAERLCTVFDVTAVCLLEWNPVWGVANQLAYYAVAGELASATGDASDCQLPNLVDNLGWQDNPQPILADHQDPNMSDWLRRQLQAHQAKTILYVPILSSQEILGCIGLIEGRASRHFSENDFELGQTIAQHTSIAITRAQLFQAEARRRREAETLLDVAEFVSSSLDRDEILTRVMEILRAYLGGVHNCAISLIKEDGIWLETIISWWADEAYKLMLPGSEFKLEKAFTANLAIDGGEPIVISDLRQIPFVNEFTKKKMKSGLRSILCVPLNIQNRPLGTLHIHHWHETRQFSAEQIAVLQGVANQTAVAVENARLFANERRQLQLSQTLQQVGKLLTASLPLEVIYDQIFELLGQAIDFDSASLFLFDKSTNQYVLVASHGFGKSVFNEGNMTLSEESVQNKLSQSLDWSVIPNVDENPHWLHREEFDSIKAWIGALLRVKGENIGLLCVDSSIVNHYSVIDGQTVAAFANQAAVAIENARLAVETARQAQELAILNQVSQETAVSLNIDRFLEKVTNLVGTELYPDCFGFVLEQEGTGALRIHPSYRGISQDAQQIEIPREKSIIGRVIETGVFYYAADVRIDPYYFAAKDDILSEIGIPLKVDNDVVGIIDVASPKIDHYSDRDIDFLTTLAGNISAVLERAKLYEAQRIQAESLAELVEKRTAELKLERDRLFAILESAGEGIILTDTQAQIVYANPAMERQSGYSIDELHQKNPRILGSNQVPKAVFADMWQRLLNQENWTGELSNRHKSGQIYDVAVTVTPISDLQGRVTGYVSVQSDITRLKELERLKTEFIANVSHQLRTPLTNIKTYVSLLNKGRPENFPRYFSVLHYEIDRLARLIQDLLDISRLDAEATPNPDASADFCDLWDMFWSPFIERAEREEKLLVLELPQSVRLMAPHIHMEVYQVEKILMRLVENGLMYTPAGGKIRVVVSWNNGKRDFLQVNICDNGPGIPEEERPFIFDRFYRGAMAVEAGLPGNGLGLAIVQELLAQYGGRIELQSIVGEGSCFKLALPLVPTNKNGNDRVGNGA
jgi:PAS domain S-box-containing protein